MATLYVRDGKVVVHGYDELAQSIKDAIQSVLDEFDVAPTFVEPSTLVAPGYLAARRFSSFCARSRRRTSSTGSR